MARLRELSMVNQRANILRMRRERTCTTSTDWRRFVCRWLVNQNRIATAASMLSALATVSNVPVEGRCTQQ